MPKKSETKKTSIEDLQKQINVLIKKVNNLELTFKNNNLVKEKKIKDPNKPKRYKSAYIFFNIDKVNEYKKNHPEIKLNIIDIAREAGKEWQNIKADEKKYEKYRKMEENDKKKYKKEIDLYEKSKK
jgi:hypothetical protein